MQSGFGIFAKKPQKVWLVIKYFSDQVIECFLHKYKSKGNRIYLPTLVKPIIVVGRQTEVKSFFATFKLTPRESIMQYLGVLGGFGSESFCVELPENWCLSAY